MTTSRREQHTKESLRLFGGVRDREGGHGGNDTLKSSILISNARSFVAASRIEHTPKKN